MQNTEDRINVKHSHPLSGQFLHFFLQFIQDMKVWLVLFGILLELDHTLVGALLQKISCSKFWELCLYHEPSSSIVPSILRCFFFWCSTQTLKHVSKVSSLLCTKFLSGSLPSSPSYCFLCRTCAAVSPSSWREDEASARFSGMLVVCLPSCSCLVTNVQNCHWKLHMC